MLSTDLGGNVKFDDDVPSALPTPLAIDGPVLVTQDAETIGTTTSDTDSQSFKQAFLDAVAPTYGADTPGTEAMSNWSLSVTNATSGLSSGGVAITLSKVDSQVVGTAVGAPTVGADNVVFTLSVDGNGQVLLTQYASIDHLPEDADGVNDNTQIALADGKVSLSATYTATDKDNDSVSTVLSTDLGGNVKFDDDISTIRVSSSSGKPTVAATGIEGFWTGSSGADVPAVFYEGSTLIQGDGFLQPVSLLGVKVAGVVLPEGQYLMTSLPTYGTNVNGVSWVQYTGRYLYDNLADSQLAVYVSFSLTVNDDRTYSLVTNIPAGTKTFDTINDSLTLRPGGPVNSKIYTITDSQTGGSLDVEFSTTPGNEVNVSGQGVGVNNNILEYDKGVYESVMIDPLGTDVVKLVNLLFTGTGQQLFSSSQGDALTINVWDTAGIAKTLTVSGQNLSSYTVDSAAIGLSSSIEKVQVVVNSTTTNLKMAVGIVVQGATPVDAVPVELDFKADVADADYDTASSSFSVLISNAVGPIALDLNHDGSVHYLSADEAGFCFGLGFGLVSTAWVSHEDGVLVYDYNADGLITDSREFVLSAWGDRPSVLTDLQALQAYFDSNVDLKFDASDSAWSSFGVWRAGVQGSLQDESQFYSLDSLGITSISLGYTGGSSCFVAADGGVEVYGQLDVDHADGSITVAHDFGLAQFIPSSADGAGAVLPVIDVSCDGGLVQTDTYLAGANIWNDQNVDGGINASDSTSLQGSQVYGLDLIESTADPAISVDGLIDVDPGDNGLSDALQVLGSDDAITGNAIGLKRDIGGDPFQSYAGSGYGFISCGSIDVAHGMPPAEDADTGFSCASTALGVDVQRQVLSIDGDLTPAQVISAEGPAPFPSPVASMAALPEIRDQHGGIFDFIGVAQQPVSI